MKFSGRIGDVVTEDAGEFARMVKAALPFRYEYSPGCGTRADRKGNAKVGLDPTISGYQVPKSWKPSPLLPDEREWLGAAVRRSDGSVGQVWALAPLRGYVWVVSDGDARFPEHVDGLTKLAGRLDQPHLGE